MLLNFWNFLNNKLYNKYENILLLLLLYIYMKWLIKIFSLLYIVSDLTLNCIPCDSLTSQGMWVNQFFLCNKKNSIYTFNIVFKFKLTI